jgi:D-alanine-D-alanine ligase
MVKHVKVAVLAGGPSTEREISLRSGKGVAKALEQEGYEVELIDFDSDTIYKLRSGNFDVVFIALHGCPGEDGTVQGMLELEGIPYTGSGVLASALCVDKIMAKEVMRCAGIPVPPGQGLSTSDPRFASEEQIETLISFLGLPVVVKPSKQGSTIGIEIVKDKVLLRPALINAASYGSQVLVEKYIQGTEVTVGILGYDEPKPLPVIEIVSKRPLYDLIAKYQAGMSEHIIPPRLPSPVIEHCQKVALQAHKTLGCEGVSRVDLIVDNALNPWVLEVNTSPGMTDVSLLPDAARAAGISFSRLCSVLVEGALARHAKAKGHQNKSKA